MIHIHFLDCWLGPSLLAIYACAFPLCWLISWTFRSGHEDGKRDRRFLLCASFLIHQTWYLFCNVNTTMELLPFVGPSERSLARKFDIGVSVFVSILAILTSFWLCRRRIADDRRDVEIVFDDNATVKPAERDKFIINCAEDTVCSAWFTLLLCYL